MATPIKKAPKAAPNAPADKAAAPAESREQAAAVAPPPLAAAGVVPATIVDAPEPPETGTVLSCRVISPLRHDGQRYKVGDLVNLSGPQAARLIGLRVVAAHDEPAAG